MLTIPYHPRHRENQERCGNNLPCIVCGKAVTSKNPAMVHVHDGGISIVTEEEAATMNPAADLCWYPIGPDCLRKHPEIKPYVAKPYKPAT